MIAKISFLEKIFFIILIGSALLIELSPSLQSLLTTVQVGNVTIPLAPIYFSLVVFIIIMFLTRLTQKLLKNHLLIKTDLNSGTQATIVSIVGYIGLTIAVLWSISELGINLKNITVVAGALSVGIGFGLQNVVNNFISGMILLFGKAIQVNDRVIINGKEGIMRKINIRSTELETTNGVRILIPNASVLNTDLTNLSTQQETNIISLKVSVPLASNVIKLQKQLTKILTSENRIALEPTPHILATEISVNSITFELSAFIKDIQLKDVLLSDLRLKIAEELKREKLI